MGSIPVGAVGLLFANNANGLICLFCERFLLLIGAVQRAKIARLISINII